MNDKFFNLPEEKRKKIINAALKVFAKNDYKHASTDDIAAEANISKGLLFHYFLNKLTLYKFIYNYTIDFIYNKMVKDDIWKYTDFFELAEVSGMQKVRVSKEYPYMFEFVMRSYFDPDPKIKEISNSSNNSMLNEVYSQIRKNIDYSKFKSDVDLSKLLNIIYWTGEGFLKKEVISDHMDFEAVRMEYMEYMDMFKKTFYKEEYL